SSTVLACGWNMYGQLATSPHKFTSTWKMVRLDVPQHTKVHSVRCGAWSTVLLCQLFDST
ncbi:hypothetical protein L9F63_010358, partial [Diploptera punctata]